MNSVSFRNTDLLLIEQSETFRLISKTNNIIEMHVISLHTLKETKFLINLCLQLQHLTIHKT
jgi:hypothetical protein